MDVGFAAPDLRPPLAAVRAAFPGANYLLFGFGDRHYLLHPGWTQMLGALWPGPGLVLVTALRATPAQAFGGRHVVRLLLNRSGMRKLQRFVWDTLASHDATVMPLQPGPYAGSAYYASVERYSAVHTCNTWAAQALQSAGLPVRSFGVEFAAELWDQVRRLRGEQRAGSARPWGAVPVPQRR